VESPVISKLLDQYGCGPVHFEGIHDALYQRHLLFDNVVVPAAAGPRERFEAFARSVRDILSQRWVLTEETYKRENPKGYYLSMEFLIGRSLANNVTNLLLSPLATENVRLRSINWAEVLEQEPDAGLGNGGLGRLAACFLDSMATMHLPAMGYGLRYEYGIFKCALTVGTRDGATIEMAAEAGEENFFLFGLTADQVADSRSWYNPRWHYDNEAETRAALDLIFSDYFSRNEPGVFEPLRETLLIGGDYYMHLADLKSYLQAQGRLGDLDTNQDAWAQKVILNVASSGKFSSDRTIAEYAADIWGVSPCPVL
jgi:glucan phosphorylase